MKKGRPFKEGLDYFELDCRMDDKVRLIQAEFGLKGFAVVVLLYQEIYGGQGYYIKWDEDRSLLFMAENGVTGGDKNLIQEIVSACVRRDIFSEDLFKKYHILTSRGIQKRYLKAVARRGKVEMKKEYLLLSERILSEIVGNNSIFVNINSINASNNSQRREEKRREENIVSKDTMSDRVPDMDTIAKMWNELDGFGDIKPIRLISGKREESVRARLKQYGLEGFREAIDRIKESDFLQGKHGGRPWTITFDWFIRPNNFPKVLEGNYSNKSGSSVTDDLDSF